MHRLHLTTGLAGFAIAVAHGTMAAVFGISGYSTAPTWVGPAALAVLAISIGTALSRRRFRRTWRWVHRVNYLVFAAVLAHGLTVGFDLRQEVLLKVCFGVYAAVVAAGLVYRVRGLVLEKR